MRFTSTAFFLTLAFFLGEVASSPVSPEGRSTPEDILGRGIVPDSAFPSGQIAGKAIPPTRRENVLERGIVPDSAFPDGQIAGKAIPARRADIFERGIVPNTAFPDGQIAGKAIQPVRRAETSK
ncbi:unnamed protein product [Peniophora sp. CBMAI 1063]|nr:unnamed protein product [Peniophora sp. CBMAI 1063]